MRYILQLNTGSFSRCTLEAKEVIDKLQYCLNMLDVEKVIFGWAPDVKLNQSICNFLEDFQVEKYLWLPVFAEIQDFGKTRKNQSIVSQEKMDFNICEGDAFEFACQSDETAVKTAVTVFDQLTEGCQVEGVFLDRIRYASVATSPEAIYGCWCPECRKIYKNIGVNLARIEKTAQMGEIEKFLPETQAHGLYHFSDPDIEKLMEAKRNIINYQVTQLCQIFRKRNLKIGIDTFAPILADFVGQDLETLGKQADFVKPMIYLKTDAPAGVPFELKGMGEQQQERFRCLFGKTADSMEQTAAQIQELSKTGLRITPGIDVNTIEGICTADVDYVRAFLQTLRSVGCDTVVLSWNVMRISKEMIDALAKVE